MDSIVIASPMSRRQLLVFIGLFAIGCALPFFVSSYRTFQLSMVLIYSIALFGLNILTGFSGQISLGHGAFYAIGAYAAAILIERFGVPYWLCVPIAGVLCLMVGFLFGVPALRLSGVYLALATFALGVALPQLLRSRHLETWTGGSAGIILNKPEPPLSNIFGINLDSDRWLYFFALFTAITMFLIGWNLLHGRIGRALIAIRDHSIAASSLGINVALYKSLAFGVSAMYTGIAGALGAIVVAFIAPDSFTIFLSITLLVGIVIGGLASISGAIYGALFVQFVPNLADHLSKAAPWAIYGATMIVLIYVMPTGFAGMLRLIGSQMSRLKVRMTQRHNCSKR